MTGPSSEFAAALADRYTFEQLLGASGMAHVWLAHDLRHDRRVALKVLRQDLGAVAGSERFLNEIRTTAQLDGDAERAQARTVPLPERPLLEVRELVWAHRGDERDPKGDRFGRGRPDAGVVVRRRRGQRRTFDRPRRAPTR